jgi:hypothetical protein
VLVLKLDLMVEIGLERTGFHQAMIRFLRPS